MSAVDGFCVICKEANEPLVTVKDRGFDSLLKYSKERKNEETTRYYKKRKIKISAHLSRSTKSADSGTTTKEKVGTLQNEKEEARASKRSNNFAFYVILYVNQKNKFVEIGV